MKKILFLLTILKYSILCLCRSKRNKGRPGRPRPLWNGWSKGCHWRPWKCWGTRKYWGPRRSRTTRALWI